MESYTMDAHIEAYVNSPSSLGDRVLQRQKLKSPELSKVSTLKSGGGHSIAVYA